MTSKARFYIAYRNRTRSFDTLEAAKRAAEAIFAATGIVVGIYA